ncbi:hypothetical protein [Embleya sp. NPDC059237]|uniref:hypothetical protein n=1 Tax=Embleya sp. NPDC059237 TaxID=3346784 RepID=UPI00369EFE40
MTNTTITVTSTVAALLGLSGPDDPIVRVVAPYIEVLERAQARAEAEYIDLEAGTWSGLSLAEYVARAMAAAQI